jgi:putative oxidoreductase
MSDLKETKAAGRRARRNAGRRDLPIECRLLPIPIFEENMVLILNRLQALGLLLLRIGAGTIFLAHGWTKLTHMAGTMKFFAGLGFPSWMAVLIGLLEVGGGILLIFGLFTRITGLLLAIEMVVAIAAVHWKQVPWWNVTGYELALACGVIAFALASFGAGVVSVDHAVFRGRA